MILYIISELLKKPNVAFEKISKNPQYFRLAAVLFAISVSISFFHQISTLIFYTYRDPEMVNIIHHVINFGGIILSHFLIIMIIFYVGKNFGGSNNFKQIFSVLSFCLVPTIIGIVIMSLGNLFFSYSMSKSTDDLSPPYALDFVFSPFVSLQFIILPFFIWSVILYVKAIKITDNFPTLKAVVLLIFTLIAVQSTSTLYNIGTSIPRQLLSV